MVPVDHSAVMQVFRQLSESRQFEYNLSYFWQLRVVSKVVKSGYFRQDTTLMLYKTLVLPLFDYGDIIYMNTSDEQLERIQKLQNMACRVILLAGPRTHIVDMLVSVRN